MITKRIMIILLSITLFLIGCDTPPKNSENDAETTVTTEQISPEKPDLQNSVADDKQYMTILIDEPQFVRMDRPSEMQINGKIETLKGVDGKKIETVLKADQLEAPLKISWSHEPDGRKHHFLIENVKRSQTQSQVKIIWNGDTIGSAQNGNKIFMIPSLTDFSVLSAQTLDNGEQGIEVRFSDPLKEDQNLHGLIHFDDDGRLSFTISGNKVHVYGSQPMNHDTVLFVEPGIKSLAGNRLETSEKFTIDFDDKLPQVRFAGKGIIIPPMDPAGHKISIPIEAINLKAVVVEASFIKQQNLPQFLQVNNLDTDSEINRVGKIVWRKTVEFGSDDIEPNKWIRYGLDLTPLMEKAPPGMFRLRLFFTRNHIVYSCSDQNTAFKNYEPASDIEFSDAGLFEPVETSYWDSYQEDYDWSEYYDQRKNPCHPAYYMYLGGHDINVSRNILFSDIGLVVKKGEDNTLFIAATDIKTAMPIENAKIDVLNYQYDILGTGTTDINGMVRIPHGENPFLVIAETSTQKGFIKIDDGLSLSVSHFDVSGKKTEKGLKGFIYGERGVWRPGDDIFLTFILQDDAKRLPADHPVTMTLISPDGRNVKTQTLTASVNGFYCFKTGTPADAPTGNWRIKINVGGAVFEKTIKIEMVKPNRLKIGLDLDHNLKDIKALTYGKFSGTISSEWLHGAIAKKLNTTLEMVLTAAETVFPKYEFFSFDDPVRTFASDIQLVFDGKLDDNGKARFETLVSASSPAPGILNANFRTSVEEPGGGASIDRLKVPFHPYKQYVGIKLPPGDKARGMLLTDKDHRVDIVMVDTYGHLVPSGRVAVELYKIKWRWWWEKGSEYIADYVGTSSYQKINQGSADIKNGKGEWTFQIKYPSWGRYLVRVSDISNNASGPEDRHITGQIFYADWPGWAGRGGADSPGGASVLNFSSDKDTYIAGEEITLTIPASASGRALISIESGSRVLQTEWVDAGEKGCRYTFKATSEMAPNIYAHVMLLQPYHHPDNDLPVRMYGVIPINIENPDSRVNPVITCDDEFTPETDAVIKVAEKSGKKMTYTLAVVDQGLLDLTRFNTPNPRDDFYQKQALGVKTWDLFDMIAGSYGGALEKILSIGGDDAFAAKGKKRSNRFPPMVRFAGPFELSANETRSHTIAIPQYIGEVRVMVVAGQNGAYGASDKAVKVKTPLMVLGTLPRVLGVDETVELPISVFYLDADIQNVQVKVTAGGLIEIENETEKYLKFTEPSDQIISFRIKAADKPGPANVVIEATAQNATAIQTMEFDIRSPLISIIRTIHPGEFKDGRIHTEIDLPGIPGTANARLEISRIPPVNLGKRMDTLIRYPHGCAEQTISTLFPQLFLPSFVRLSPEQEKTVQKNINLGIEKLASFQEASGGFTLWPGKQEPDPWISSYAGYFLFSAKKLGYVVPSGTLQRWKHFQSKNANRWLAGPRQAELIQAYRLFTLAFADAVELGAMNRLKESNHLTDVARWRLACAYQLAGQPEVAGELVQNLSAAVITDDSGDTTYGDEIRDKAMILEAMLLLNQTDRAASLVDDLSKALDSDQWMSTQATAHALIAMAKSCDLFDKSQLTEFSYSWDNHPPVNIEETFPLVDIRLPHTEKNKAWLTIDNKGGKKLYPRIVVESTPLIGQEQSISSGLTLEMEYSTLKKEALDPVHLVQGTDFEVLIKVKNTGTTGSYKNLALTYMVPSGWEIRNSRLDFEDLNKINHLENIDYRDDRINFYFDLESGAVKTLPVRLSASYPGKFYLPATKVEAMYDGFINAVEKGTWVTISKTERSE